MPDPIARSITDFDLSDRFLQSQAVAASPSGSSITTICTLTWSPQGSPPVVSGVELQGWAAFTVGTNGVSAKLDIRRGSSSGTVVATTGALTVSATNLVAFSVQGLDTNATSPGQVWVLCLTIGSGSAASTVSACQLFAEVI